MRDVSARAKVLDISADLPELDARVRGPIGLDESDTVNNFAHANVSQSVFANGFEP